MKKSFTLIELLIVIGIMAIFTALTLSIMVSIRQQRQVKVVAEQVKSRIMEAHSFAVNPPTEYYDKTTIPDNQFKGVEVKIDNGSSPSLTVYALNGINQENALTATDPFPSNISFSGGNSHSPVKIYFSVSGSDIGQASSDNQYDLTFTITGTNNRSYKLTINQFTGSVEIK